MSSPRSPYKEADLNARAFPKKRKRQDVAYGLFYGYEKGLPKNTHRWDTAYDARRITCVECRQPKFVAEMTKCSGGKRT